MPAPQQPWVIWADAKHIIAEAGCVAGHAHLATIYLCREAGCGVALVVFSVLLVEAERTAEHQGWVRFWRESGYVWGCPRHARLREPIARPHKEEE